MPAAIAATCSNDSHSLRRSCAEALVVVDGPLLGAGLRGCGEHALDGLVDLIRGLVRVDPFAVQSAVVVGSETGDVDAGR